MRGACVTTGACVVVIAGGPRNRRVGAHPIGTRVRRALVVVVALRRAAALVAAVLDLLELAAAAAARATGLTHVIGTHIAVVAGDGRAGALALRAQVVLRARVGVGSARVAVVAEHAGDHAGACTLGRGAHVAGRALVAVVARQVVVLEHATAARVAAVGGTQVAVVAADRAAGARAGAAGVAVGAGVAVAATSRVVGLLAAGDLVASVGGALVAVVAVGRRVDRRAGACPRRTLVAQRTRIAVVARQVVVAEHAAAAGIASIVGTGVVVVAGDTGAGARTAGALVVRSTGVTVVASVAVGGVGAGAIGRVAGSCCGPAWTAAKCSHAPVASTPVPAGA